MRASKKEKFIFNGNGKILLTKFIYLFIYRFIFSHDEVFLHLIVNLE